MTIDLNLLINWWNRSMLIIRHLCDFCRCLINTNFPHRLDRFNVIDYKHQSVLSIEIDIDSLRVHFSGKIQNRIIAWDYTDSFLWKKQKIQKNQKIPKRIFTSRQLIACSIVKIAYHMDFFRILSQRNTKVVNPKNPDSD